MMYPYHLGCHLKTGQLCRIPHPDLGAGIPVGFCRILYYKRRRYIVHPHPNGELMSEYWSLPRWTDIQRYLGEPITGPIMFQLMIGNE